MKNSRVFCERQNRFKTVFKYLSNRNTNRIKIKKKKKINLQYYFNTIFNDDFKRFWKKQV